MIDADIKKLDELAKKMESGELPLEKTLELFNEGVELIRKCSKSLEEAELRVKEIVEAEPGKFNQSPV